MAIKGIFFDATDVFYRRPLSTQKYALDLLNDQGVALDLAAQDQPRHMVLRSLAMRGQISPDEYWDQFLLLRGRNKRCEKGRPQNGRGDVRPARSS